MAEDRRSPSKTIKTLWRRITAPMHWSTPLTDKDLRRAVRQAARNGQFLRYALLVVRALYAKTLGSKEFVLRRPTTLSLYTFAILAVPARIQKDLDEGC